jgi:hypothetical protein
MVRLDDGQDRTFAWDALLGTAIRRSLNSIFLVRVEDAQRVQHAVRPKLT